MKFLISILLIINMSINNSFAANIGPKPFVYYRYPILEEANGIAIIDISFVPFDIFEVDYNNELLMFTNNKKSYRFLLNDNMNNKIIDIIERHAPKEIPNSNYYGAMKIDLKNGRTFYILMNTNNHPTIIKGYNK